MRLERLSIKNLCLLIGAGALLSMLAITAALYALTGSTLMLWGGAALTACALAWLFLLVLLFGKRLSVFTGELCRISRLYSVMLENRRKVDKERQELQMLVPDISYQVKTPMSNLKMVTEARRTSWNFFFKRL